jgi:hypothetical protein
MDQFNSSSGFDSQSPKFDLGQIKQWVTDFKSGLPEPWSGTLDGAVKWVRQNPKTTAAIGVAAGFAVGFLGARRISKGFELAAKSPKATSMAMQAVSGLVAAVAMKGGRTEASPSPVSEPMTPNRVTPDSMAVTPPTDTFASEPLQDMPVQDASLSGATSPDVISSSGGTSDVEGIHDPQLAVEMGESTGAAPGVVTQAGAPLEEDRPLSPSDAQAGSRA